MRIIFLVLGISLLLFIVGCAPQQTEPAVPAASAEEQEIDSGLDETDTLDLLYDPEDINFEELDDLPLE